jgi:hypothetical protein
VADEHVGTVLPGVLQQGVQLLDDLRARARLWPRLAPPDAGAVVGAHPRERRDLRLHGLPVQHAAPETGVHHDGRCPFPFTGAVELHVMTGYGDHLPWGRIPLVGEPGGDELVDRPGER